MTIDLQSPILELYCDGWAQAPHVALSELTAVSTLGGELVLCSCCLPDFLEDGGEIAKNI